MSEITKTDGSISYLEDWEERLKKKINLGYRHPIFNKKYFIEKFTAIPEDQWCRDELQNDRGQHCAAGLCGARDDNDLMYEEGSEVYSLYRLLGEFNVEKQWQKQWKLPMINDGKHPAYQQDHPKKRILAALNDLPND